MPDRTSSPVVVAAVRMNTPARRHAADESTPDTVYVLKESDARAFKRRDSAEQCKRMLRCCRHAGARYARYYAYVPQHTRHVIFCLLPPR